MEKQNKILIIRDDELQALKILENWKFYSQNFSSIWAIFENKEANEFIETVTKFFVYNYGLLIEDDYYPYSLNLQIKNFKGAFGKKKLYKLRTNKILSLERVIHGKRYFFDIAILDSSTKADIEEAIINKNNIDSFLFISSNKNIDQKIWSEVSDILFKVESQDEERIKSLLDLALLNDFVITLKGSTLDSQNILILLGKLSTIDEINLFFAGDFKFETISADFFISNYIKISSSTLNPNIKIPLQQ